MLMERKKGRDIEGFQATLYTKENQTGNAQRTYIHTPPQGRARITNQNNLAKMERIGRKEVPIRKINLAQKE